MSVSSSLRNAFKLFCYDRNFLLIFLSLIARQIFSFFLIGISCLVAFLSIHSLASHVSSLLNALISFNCHLQLQLADLFTLEIIHKFLISFTFYICALRQFLNKFIEIFFGSFQSLWDLLLSNTKMLTYFLLFFCFFLLFFASQIFCLNLKDKKSSSSSSTLRDSSKITD